jgi:hypothetical protein
MSMPKRLPQRSPNRMESVRKLIKKLGSVEKLRVCYEAGPTGYVLYWQLAELGVQCEVCARAIFLDEDAGESDHSCRRVCPSKSYGCNNAPRPWPCSGRDHPSTTQNLTEFAK